MIYGILFSVGGSNAAFDIGVMLNIEQGLF